MSVGESGGSEELNMVSGDPIHLEVHGHGVCQTLRRGRRSIWIGVALRTPGRDSWDTADWRADPFSFLGK
ncbi:hypothetical protein TIFTF001_017620 [Ficus carica]|uniref:Uncharacterized protein n=1 Tax=Ficus carica TaxID=3494 RepID=A0AA88A9U2_FICCA|nr:hypothetical protein TIFTF001_017620 [Ficus carica]